MTEKVKAEKSFWYPYLNIAPKEYTLLDWTDKEVENIGDSYLFKQFKECKSNVIIIFYLEGIYFHSFFSHKNFKWN